MAYLNRLLRSSAAPSAAFTLANIFNENGQSRELKNKVACEANPVPGPIKGGAGAGAGADIQKETDPADQEILFHGLFPLRQLWKPKVEYPLFDGNWDNRKPETTGDKVKDHQNSRYIRKHGVTRHIILIRHGQYDETHREDEKRILTPLGRKQAELTGKRLAEMIAGLDEQFGPCHVNTIRVSNMARAKETADIIAKELPDSVIRAEPDPMLNEGRPCHTIPGGKVSSNTIMKTDEGNKRIEQAFQTYFYRADSPELPKENEETKGNSNESINKEAEEVSAEEEEGELKGHPQHSFEIIVCHANVVRYFMCRALQLPPEAWLRMCTFNCSLNYVAIRPSGSVSVRMLGDIGHLGYKHSTFSMHHGFNW
jgi:serine/threonine-protein phosphatase PGAM5